ncbi:MAG: LiaF transmembrane domain-containing protein [Mucilaginibacter sp.]
METIIDNPNKQNGKTMAGIIIVIIGGLLLIDQLDLFFIPGWLFSWPMWIIAYGIYMGGKYNFKKPVWLWLVVMGTAFLLTENFDNADKIVWPVAIIGTGAWMVMKHTKHHETSYQQTNYKEI